ncbi:valine--tRNA ligase [Kytococcus sedentarius]|uniref:valine--tRNA ligase n=1 Tax=Kytococcus sedentarius TaxID=1276 RepID=UPI00384E8593
MTDSTAGTRPAQLPEKPSVDGLEDRWTGVWQEQDTYAFDRARAASLPREQLFTIDTPPPTASGSLHVGHVFGYTQADCMARYKRMSGAEVFYPIGWDDNGLPTERRVQNYYGVRGDITQPYVEGYEPPQRGGDGKSTKAADQQPVSRPNFIELCHELTVEDEKAFEALFRRLGLSLDWNYQYRTIDDNARATSQQAFLRNLQRGEAYSAEAPGLWDVTFQTAVAQAELEARDYPGAYHRIAFHGPQGDVEVETTRPELLPACVALIAHPDDERYQDLFGSTVRTPLFGVEVPVIAHPAAEMDKGAGIAMCCTFGDLTDVTWWRELQLPTRSVITRNGRLTGETPAWLADGPGAQLYAEQLATKTVHTARENTVTALRESGELVGEPEKTQRKANFFEKGDKPLEIVTSRQWYIRNGGRDAELNRALIERGAEVDFHPAYMERRHANWIEGLNGDWLVSRQRFFGVPFPIWYPLDADGEPDHENPITPAEADLPVDPQTDTAPGYEESQRDQPGGFTADPDVLDTWATSSLTPQIIGGWRNDPELFDMVFPMDVRPQGHDIIRTWLFSTIVRSHHEHGTVPWRNATLNGWILDPDRKKMSKSKGNVVTPVDLLEQHGSDAVRYWAASARQGVDTAFDAQQMKVGRRLAIKLLNASKFALGFGEVDGAEHPEQLLAQVTEPVDQSLLLELARVVEQATAGFEAWDYTKALEVTEAFFWSFCDDYLELVKARAYGGDEAEASPATTSARAALRVALDVQLRLLAPFIPFATEEVWSWWHSGSVHRAAWPTADEVRPAGWGDAADVAGVKPAAAAVLAGIRKAKSEAKLGMRAQVTAMTLAGPAEQRAAARRAWDDVVASGHVVCEVAEADAEELEVRDTELLKVEKPKA